MIIKLKKQILEAIDQLRGRKARPDIERICNHVHRRYNVDPQETLMDLERLVDDEQVIRVEYKGSTSYRNVAKWPRYKVYKNKPHAANLITSNSERTTSMLEEALKVLITQKPIFKVSGVPYDEIYKYLITIYADNTRFKNKNNLDTVIAREINSGNIIMLENGNYLLETCNLDNLEVPKLDLENSGVLSAFPIKLIKPWMHDTNDGAKDVDLSALPNKTQRMYDVLKICRALRDAEKKIMNKRKKADQCKNRNKDHSVIAAPVTAVPSESEGASPVAPGTTTTPAMRVGSRRKRAPQVFDPSDNNLPRNRNKRGRPITGNAKQLQQHAIQHQLLRMRHQQNITTTAAAAISPTSITSISSSSTTTTTTNDNTTPIKQENKIIVAATKSTPVTPVKTEIKEEITTEITTPTLSVKKLSKITPNKTKSPKPPKTPPKSLSPSPSSEGSPSGSTLVSSASDDAGCCIVCKDDVSNKSYRLVNCLTCHHRVHPLCLKTMDNPTSQPAMKHALKWQCMQCRLCTICNTGREDKREFLVVCHCCDDSFHASCHAPALLKKPTQKWLCYACTVKKALSVGQSMVTYGDKTSTQSLPIMHVHTSNGSMMDIDESSTPESWDPEEMGEVMNWSSDDVSAYFTSQGFSDEAAIMKEQDVDGKSLLLMKRIDVLRGLKLKLGPALKMYNNHVLRMQVHHFSNP